MRLRLLTLFLIFQDADITATYYLLIFHSFQLLVLLSITANVYVAVATSFMGQLSLRPSFR